MDDTLKFYRSPTGTYRFGLEAFEFVDQPFVFIHCHVIICNASNPQSRCARGCEKKARLRREVEHHNLFSLAQGPITLDHEIELDQKHVEKFSVNNMDSVGKREVQLEKFNIHKKGVHFYLKFRTREIPH